VVLDGTSTKPSRNDSVLIVKELRITAAYTGVLTLANPGGGGIHCNLTVKDGFTIAGGTIRYAAEFMGGSLDAKGENNYTSLITGGTFQSMGVYFHGRARIDGSFAMNGSSFLGVENGGRLVWANGSVSTNATNDIGMRNSGVFEVTSSGTFSGSMVNETTMIVSGSPTFRGVTNSQDLRVDAGGTLKCSEWGTQEAGTTELRGGTIKMLSDTAFSLLDGRLIGSGTIDGNLPMGYDPQAPGGPIPSCPVLQPGTENAPGTIAISKSFESFTDGASINILFKSLTNFSKVTITGYARLKGALDINFSLDPGTPQQGSFAFMTFGAVAGDFHSKVSTNYYIVSTTVGPTSYTIGYSDMPP
jgi:hypothetical protein